MRITLLKPVDDGTGEKPIGTECVFPDKDALRLISLGAAVMVKERSKPVSVSNIMTKKPVDNPTSTEDDFLSQEEYEAILKELTQIDSVNDEIADQFMTVGIQSVEDVARASLDDLKKIKGIGEKSARKIKLSAKSLMK